LVFLVGGCMGSRSLAIWNLFFKWFRDTFIPHCGSARPVLLLLDNHESPITIEVIQLARAKRIEILEFPAHTTHIVQPLDVSINGPFKAHVYKTATNLKFNQLLRTLNRYMRVLLTLKAKWKS
jgi:hypothetical protein